MKAEFQAGACMHASLSFQNSCANLYSFCLAVLTDPRSTFVKFSVPKDICSLSQSGPGCEGRQTSRLGTPQRASESAIVYVSRFFVFQQLLPFTHFLLICDQGDSFATLTEIIEVGRQVDCYFVKLFFYGIKSSNFNTVLTYASSSLSSSSA